MTSAAERCSVAFADPEIVHQPRSVLNALVLARSTEDGMKSVTAPKFRDCHVHVQSTGRKKFLATNRATFRPSRDPSSCE